MSSTVAQELYRVRRLLGDRQSGEPIVGDALLEELLYDAMDEIYRETGAGDIRQPGFAVVGPTATAVTVSGTYPAMRHLKHLIRETDSHPLEKCTPAEMYAAKAHGSTFGPPTHYTLSPETDEGILLETYPTPQTPMNLTAIWEPVPAAVSQVSGTIFMAPTSLIALRNRVAGQALQTLTKTQLEKLGKDSGLAEIYLKRSEAAAADEWHRLHVGEMGDLVVRMRRGV